MRAPNRLGSFVFMLAWGLLGSGHAGFGQAVAVKSGNVPPGKTIPEEIFKRRHLVSPGSLAALNLKQQRIRAQHRPIPLGPLPPGVNLNAPGKPSVNATEVLTRLLPVEKLTVQLLSEHALTTTETGQGTSLVCEPSVGVRGQGGKEVLYTGNWFAAFSKDSGSTFEYVNPFDDISRFIPRSVLLRPGCHLRPQE